MSSYWPFSLRLSVGAVVFSDSQVGEHQPDSHPKIAFNGFIHFNKKYI